jgi:hypothetical protein
MIIDVSAISKSYNNCCPDFCLIYGRGESGSYISDSKNCMRYGRIFLTEQSFGENLTVQAYISGVTSMAIGMEKGSLV